MSYKQQINDWFKTFDQRMQADVPTIVAETATAFYQERFKTQEWDKIPWQTLKPSYVAKKTRGKGQILTASGALQRSVRPTVVNAERVVISAGNSLVPYARIHNEGLTVTGAFKVRPHLNRNFMGKGKQVQIRGHVRNVNFKMPRRQFMGHSIFLNVEIIKNLTNAYNK